MDSKDLKKRVKVLVRITWTHADWVKEKTAIKIPTEPLNG